MGFNNLVYSSMNFKYGNCEGGWTKPNQCG
jgi:hypothetical protein